MIRGDGRAGPCGGTLGAPGYDENYPYDSGADGRWTATTVEPHGGDLRITIIARFS
jgi:hypothetical protein